MKDKRILAMFVTAVVTLVTSLAVTFGVLVSLADPVVATGIIKYDYNFNGEYDQTLIYKDQDTLGMVNEITFQPTSAVEWEDRKVVWPNTNSYEDAIIYGDESVSTKLKVAPIKITNNFDVTIEVNIDIEFDRSSTLGQYTFVKLYDFSEGKFEEYNGSKSIYLSNGGDSKEFLVIIYADDADNLTQNRINWGSDYLTVNVKVTNNTVIG